MGKKTEKARREDLKDMSLFRLKRVAAQAGADAEKVRSCEVKSEVIELIIEKEFGDDEEPKRTKVKDKEESVKDKKGKKRDEDDEEEKEPKGKKGKKDEDDEEPKGKKGKGKKDEDDDDADSDDDDDKDDDDDDEGDDDKDKDDDGDDDDDKDDDDDDGDDDDKDKKPKRQAVKKDDLTEKIDALTTLVEELKSDIEGTTRFAAGAYLILKAALPVLGKTVGTKGMTKKITEIVEKLFPPKSKDDKDDDKEED